MDHFESISFTQYELEKRIVLIRLTYSSQDTLFDLFSHNELVMSFSSYTMDETTFPIIFFNPYLILSSLILQLFSRVANEIMESLEQTDTPTIENISLISKDSPKEEDTGTATTTAGGYCSC